MTLKLRKWIYDDRTHISVAFAVAAVYCTLSLTTFRWWSVILVGLLTDFVVLVLCHAIGEKD